MRHRNGAVTVQHDQITGIDLRAADQDAYVQLSHFTLRRSLRAHVARPDRQPELRELVEIADRTIDEHPGDAAHVRLRREQLTDESDRRRLGAREHEHIAGSSLSDSCVHHRVVARHTPCDAGGTGDARARHDLRQLDIDDPDPPGGLVDRRHTEPRERRVVRQSASTTTGSSRWKASA